MHASSSGIARTLPADADMVISGAGPAGATAAYVAAKRGLRTVLVEKRGPPRDKTCGGLLTRRCVEHVRQTYGCLVPPEVQIAPSPLPLFVAPPSGRAQGFRVPGEDVINVTRRRFDGWLAQLAAEAGAHLLHDTEVIGYRVAADGVTVRVRSGGKEASIRAAHLIGADGVYSPVRAQLSPRPHRSRAYYIQQYMPRAGQLEDAFYLMYRGSVSPIYAYAMPKGDAWCLGIGVHASTPPAFGEGMARFKAWLTDEFGFVDRGVLRSEGYSVPFGNIVFGDGRVLLAGDAAGFCYPPTGEGITFAIQSGAEAATAIAEAGTDALLRYAARMGGVAEACEAAAARTLTLTDEMREARIRTKGGL